MMRLIPGELVRACAALFAAGALFAAEEPARPIRLDVASQPEGAEVTVDGERLGLTPVPTVFTLKAGRHHLHFTKPGYDPADVFVRLEPGSCVQAAPVLSPLKGILLLTTEPKGCEVTVDGLSLGETPRLITTLSVLGVHRLKLQKPGYLPRQVEVKFDGRIPVVRHEKMILDSGVVAVSSEPAGAEVTVNGVSRGRTPLEISGIPKGRATVRVELDGYGPETRELQITPGERQELSLRLSGSPGALRLSTVPEGARIYVNGEYRGKTRVELPRLAPGAYAVKVELDGYANEERTVTVGNGAQVTEEFRLRNVMGRLEVRTIPVGASVSLDGRAKGSTSAKDPAARHSDILAIENLREGEHVLKIEMDGYTTVVRHPQVRNGATVQEDVRLARIFTPDIEVITANGTYRGVKVALTATQVEIEIKPGVNRTFLRSEVRGINFIGVTK